MLFIQCMCMFQCPLLCVFTFSLRSVSEGRGSAPLTPHTPPHTHTNAHTHNQRQERKKGGEQQSVKKSNKSALLPRALLSARLCVSPVSNSFIIF